MSQSSIRKLLGYSPKDPYILSEADADDVVDAYRDLIAMAKGSPEFEELIDGIVSFLDAVSEMDPDNQIEAKLIAALREKVISDDFKEQVKSVLAVVGESRLYSGARQMNESLEDLDAEMAQLDVSIKMARDFHEVATEVSNFMGKLREMNAELGSSIEAELVTGMAEYMDSLKKTIVSKAKKLGME